MTGNKETQTVKVPLRAKLLFVILITALPLLFSSINLIYSLMDYSRSYDEIVNNLTIANDYNINFKEEMDESLYKLVVGYMSFENIKSEEGLKDPYALIESIQNGCRKLLMISTDKESRIWLQSLLRNTDTLKNRVDDIKANLTDDGHYEENIAMLDNDIYILTELIQDDIQYYIYYQTRNIEQLKNELNNDINRFIILNVAIVLGMVIIATIAALLLVKSITKPINELCGIASQIAHGDFSARAKVQTKDEIGVLAAGVNDMSEHLEIMVNQIQEDERKMRYAELRLLQEQINPHFLYNTLDTIVWLIEGEDTTKAVHVVMSLSEFFRRVLSKGKEFVTIEDEMQYIRSYLEIQQARYADILDYEIDIDPSLYPYKILKMTLQPMVENSLYHGIKYKRAKGLIRVSGEKQGDKILLYIEDNGVGMTPQETEALTEKINMPCNETGAGFGLANVNERIRMNFGQEYGLFVQSQKGKGTKITIAIPATELEHAEGMVQQ